MAVPRSRRYDPLDVVRHLITAIGPRPATSLGEAKAAAYIDSRLRHVGLKVSADTFHTTHTLGPIYPVLALLGITAALVLPLPPSLWFLPWPVPWPLVSLVLALYGLYLAINDCLGTPLPALARPRASQNIVATRASTAAEDPNAPPPRWRVVLLAPLDSAQLPGQRRAARRQPVHMLGRIWAFSMLLLIALVVVLFQPAALIYVAMAVPACYLLLTILPLYNSPGQVSLLGGAGALAGLLAVVERLGSLEQVELWAVGLGATSTGDRGLANLLARYPFPREQTLFLALQHLGTGPLIHATREGIFQQYAADDTLAHLIATATRRNSDPVIQARPYLSADSLAGGLHSRGYRAMTLLTPSGALPVEDDDELLACLDDDAIDAGIRLVVAMIELLNSEAQTTPAASASHTRDHAHLLSP